ncbi:MAG: tetratricopeptide repeat protein, partial [Tannerellaceae bacterium]
MKKLLIILAILNISAISLSAQINTDRVMSIGRNALYFEDYVLSIQYFNQVIKAKPWMAEPYFYRAVAKLNLDDLQGAESDCSLCIERNPYIAMSYFCRGISRQGQEKYAEAIADYTLGLKYKPDDKQMLLNRAIAAIQSKDYQHAAPYFDELFEYYPRNTMGYIARGSMNLEQGDTIKAINDYDKAI